MTQANRLIHETSPYLKQHAHNPVDWYPWGPDALARARQLDRPIFLSIGYSACHWCHVMEHESFEDPKVGDYLNAHFVSIKVDREERPDLDQIYMTAVQLLTQSGGWPMSVFLTPDLQPFFGGTYFPPDRRYNRPSFMEVLQAVVNAWTSKREAVGETAQQLTQNIQNVMQVEAEPGELTEELLRNGAALLARRFDSRYGGFGAAPKFPHPMDLRMLLRAWKRFGDAKALEMATFTLDAMALGGIYDHLGGGFHRYSTDERWLVPHFEKMLYDNALLTLTYTEAYQATRRPLYREVVEQTIDYIRREMRVDGGFASAQDADSEGVEGKFFVWSAEEIAALLGPEEARVFAAVYQVSPGGNWEGHNILHRRRSFADEARDLGIDEASLCQRLAAARGKLLEARSTRVAPARDDKVLTAWNGLMIHALARAGQALDRPDVIALGLEALDFVATRLMTPEGQLRRTCGASGAAKLDGYLEDYAYFLEGAIALYEASAMGECLEIAQQVADTLCRDFWDEKDGGFFFTGKSHETLIARTKDQHDSSTPSGNGVAATALLRLAKFTGNTDHRDKAVATLRLFRGLMASSPMAAGQMLLALDFHLGPVDEIVVAGDPKSPDVRAVLRAVQDPFRPLHVLAVQLPNGHGLRTESLDDLPLLKDKKPHGSVTTYICRDFTCQAPRVGVEASKQVLG